MNEKLQESITNNMTQAIFQVPSRDYGFGPAPNIPRPYSLPIWGILQGTALSARQFKFTCLPVIWETSRRFFWIALPFSKIFLRLTLEPALQMCLNSFNHIGGLTFVDIFIRKLLLTIGLTRKGSFFSLEDDRGADGDGQWNRHYNLWPFHEFNYEGGENR